MQHSTYLLILSSVVLWLGPACAPKQPGAKQESQPVASIQPMAPKVRTGAISLAVLPWMVSGGHEDEDIGV